MPNFKNLAPTCTGITVQGCTHTHPQHMKMLKHFQYINYGCKIQSGVVYSLKHDTMMLFGLTLTPNYPKFDSHPQWCNSVRVHPYAHPQHMKVLKHFQYIQYECKKQSEVVYSVGRIYSGSSRYQN